MQPAPSGEDRERPADLDDLAAQFMAETGADRPARLDDYLARLKSDADRKRFRTLVNGAKAAERSLPVSVADGRMLSGRYRIGKCIGTGGMGRVYAAHDLPLDRAVAVKVLPALEVGDREREELLLKESRLLASLNHPNIVAVHEVGRDRELVYVVMDLIDGVALSDTLSRASKILGEQAARGGNSHPRGGELLRQAIGKDTPVGRPDLIDDRSWYRSAAAIMVELARTLEAAHSKQVIHRDLKPGNIMLLGGGSPVVLDFGLAGQMNKPAGEVTSSLYGSVAYLAPEQAKSFKVGADLRSDVYQLGLVLYELLTLRRAFTGDAIGPVLENIRHGIFDPPRRKNPFVPRELEAICLKAMELDPEKRFQSARELREDLERYLAGIEPPLAVRFHFTRRVSMQTRYFTRRFPRATVSVLMSAAFVIAAPFVIDALTWRVPDLQPIKIPAGSGEPVPTDTGREVAVGDSLGMIVDGPDPSFVYALSIFGGDESDSKYVVPLDPEPLREVVEDLLADATRAGGRPQMSWGLRIASGRESLLCTFVEPIDGVHEQEELWLFATAAREPFLEEWLAQVDKLHDPELRPGVPYLQAFGILSDLQLSGRGAAVRDLSTEEKRRYLSHLSLDRVAGLAKWTLPRSTRSEYHWAVTPYGALRQ